MKKYFTKYLPVEGEIQEGDWAQDTNYLTDFKGQLVHITDVKHTGTTFKSGKNQHGGVYSTEGLAKLKKVKLFLCTRDIQIGDKVRYGDNPTALEHEADSSCSVNRCYKVVGEVSSKALWVKEGDEFDEYDLIFSDNYTEYTWESLQKLVKLAGPTNWADFITVKIKCSTCKTFH